MHRATIATATTLAALAGPAHGAGNFAQEFTFGPTGYTLLTVALFGILWRLLRPHKQHRRNTDKWPWE